MVNNNARKSVLFENEFDTILKTGKIGFNKKRISTNTMTGQHIFPFGCLPTPLEGFSRIYANRLYDQHQHDRLRNLLHTAVGLRTIKEQHLPVANAISLTKSTLENQIAGNVHSVVVCEKTDGVRFWLWFHQNRIWLLNRACMIWEVSHWWKHKDLLVQNDNFFRAAFKTGIGTIVDCELIFQNGTLFIVWFDMVHELGIPLFESNFATRSMRLQIRYDYFMQHYSTNLITETTHVANASVVPIVVLKKQFHSLRCVPTLLRYLDLLRHEIPVAFEHIQCQCKKTSLTLQHALQSDGLMFLGTQHPMVFGKDVHCFKWKWHPTVDLLCRCFSNDSNHYDVEHQQHPSFQYGLQWFAQNEHNALVVVQMDAIAPDDWRAWRELDGCIVECEWIGDARFHGGGRWCALKPRRDKGQPNSEFTVHRTKESIAQNVGAADLVQYCATETN